MGSTVEGLGGFDVRSRSAGQQDGHVDEGLDGLGCPAEEAHAQAGGVARRRDFEGVLVGREAGDVAPAEEVLETFPCRSIEALTIGGR